MELRHLRYFVAVAEAGSLTRAAEGLGMQQPPLGQQIRSLEREIGVQLFDRRSRCISLNAAGNVFLEDARDILRRAENAAEHVRRFDQGESGTLRIGLTSSASFHALVPELLRRFRQTHPRVKIEVEESETYELILGLRAQRIDAAVLRIATGQFPDLASTIVAEEDMVVAVPLGHPFAKPARRPITLRMLNDQPLVVYRRPDGPGIFEGILRAFADAGVTPRIVDEVHRLIAAINLVAAGRGLTLVPASMQVLHRESAVYRPLARGALPALAMHVAYRRDTKLALIRNFLSVTKALAGTISA
jgi:DNA-binding transcriptional LysR family regulator